MTDDGIGRRGFVTGAGLLPFAAFATGTAAPEVVGTARLSLNENPFGPAPGVARAIEAELERLGRYADRQDADALVDRIARIEDIPPEQVVLGDILESLGRHLAARAPAGGRFILSLPGYTALVDAARPLGGVAIGVPLDARLRNDLPALGRAIGDDARALFLVNPHNPSGTMNPAGDFQRFVAEAARRTLVIVDEAYLDYDDPRASAVDHVRAGANVAVFRTFDKIHGLAALPLGYMLAPRPLADALRAAGMGGVHGQGRITLAAAAAALADPDWIGQVRIRTLAGRRRLEAALTRLGLEQSDSRANFVFFRSPIAAEQLRARLAEAGILVGRAFPPLDEWVRITVGTEPEVDRTIAALHAILHPSDKRGPS